MAARPVPADYDELVQEYDPLVRWVITRTARLQRQNQGVRISHEDFEDLRQHVYTVMLHRDYLARCRAYLSTHNGSMTTSLYAFVKRVAINWFRDEKTRTSYHERATADVKVINHDRSGDSRRREREADVLDERDALAGIEAGIMLDEFAAKLPSSAGTLLQVCRLEGDVSGEVITKHLPDVQPKSALRHMRRALKEIHGPLSGVRNSSPRRAAEAQRAERRPAAQLHV